MSHILPEMLKEAKCEILDLLDFRYFYTTKPLWFGDLGIKRKKLFIFIFWVNFSAKKNFFARMISNSIFIRTQFLWDRPKKYFFVVTCKITHNWKEIFVSTVFCHHKFVQKTRFFYKVKFGPCALCMKLKVPSGQIGSAWEWYHWKAL